MLLWTVTYILVCIHMQVPNSPESFIRLARSRRVGSSSFFFFFFAFLMSVGDCEGCGGGVGVEGCGTAISAGPDEVCICCSCNVWPDDISLTSCWINKNTYHQLYNLYQYNFSYVCKSLTNMQILNILESNSQYLLCGRFSN